MRPTAHGVRFGCAVGGSRSNRSPLPLAVWILSVVGFPSGVTWGTRFAGIPGWRYFLKANPVGGTYRTSDSNECPLVRTNGAY